MTTPFFSLQKSAAVLSRTSAPTLAASCATYTNRGKDTCPAKRIREDILMEKCAEALGLDAYDAGIFQVRVLSILIPGDGILVFRFKDGTEKTIHWEKRSRRDSWTDEMKAAAKQHAAARREHERE